MWKILVIGAVTTSVLVAQTGPSPVDFANLREDVRGLAQRVGELSLRVEQLERENNELRLKAGASERNYATLQQVNDAVEALHRTVRSEMATADNDVLQRVATQIEKLAQQTNAALDAMAKSSAVRPAVQAPAADLRKGEGSTYTVQKGDTLATIARKTGARQQDIVSANKLADPSRILVGQILIIPNPSNAAK